MTIRWVHRKQVVNLVSEQEQRAKQKLLEISIFDDEKQYDYSKMMHACKQTQPIDKLKMLPITSISKPSKKKSISLAAKKEDISSLEDNTSRRKQKKDFQFDDLGDASRIFNTLESNRVFVGHKAAFISSARAHLPEKAALQCNKKRMETMPVIKQTSYLQLPHQKQHTSSNKLTILMDFSPSKYYKPEKWKLAGLLTHKSTQRQSLIKLKLKFKQEVFNTQDERIK